MKVQPAASVGVFGLPVVLAALAAWTPAGVGGEAPAELLPAAFDLRSLDCVTPVKQQLGGTCWTHGTMAAIESNLMLSGYWRAAGGLTLPALSEYHLDWWNGFNKHANEDLPDPARDPSGLRVHFGGDYRVAAAYLSRGDGVVALPRGNDAFRDRDWYAKAPPRSDPAYQRFYVRDVEWFVIGDNLENIDAVKRRIMTDGAVGTCYCVNRSFMSPDNIHYQPPSSPNQPNHAVAIVGWDDAKVSADPARKAPRPGAWLIKNSGGTRRGEQGFNWISYYDKHCCRHPEMGAVSFRNIEPMVYTHVYCHDYHGWRDTFKGVSRALNAFKATGRQLIRTVSFVTAQSDVRYTVKIYRRFEKGQLQGEVASRSGSVPFTGVHAVNLDVPVLVQDRDTFYVVLELSAGGQAIDRTSEVPVLLGQPARRERPPTTVVSRAGPGESFYHDGSGWKDLYDYHFANPKYDHSANFCIKALAVSAEESPALKAPALLAGLEARTIGPANMGGRVVDVEVVESDPNTMYVAAATGGLWKTADGGNRWEPVFDRQGTLCIGDVAVAPSDPNVVWVGTGEANARNSVSWGDGVYKSTDAGKTWTHVGLRDSHHIGRIAIHPKNPDVVYVAALGHLWGPNRERGLYRTADGGKTWQRVKYVNVDTGFIDVAIDMEDPNVVYAAAYQVRRDGFAGGNPKVGWGPGSGLFRTEDGGKTWAKMTQGLPDRPLGRCGLAVFRKDPRVVYAVVQTDKTNTSARGQSQGRQSGPVEAGGVFRSDDKGKTWAKVNDLCPRPFYYGQVRVDPVDDRRVYVLGVQLHVSDDGGKTFKAAGRGAHPDHHALWINPRDTSHMVLGNDGGLYFSRDKGASWAAVRGMPLGQFYGVAVDMRQPYRVYGGLQDNGSWGGPSATDSAEGITLADWKRVGGGDGFQCQADPSDPDTIYCETQYGGLRRVSLKGGRPKLIRPRAPEGQPAYRFNWNAPLLLSPHDPKTVYYGGNVLFKSVDRGDKWEVISPDLTRGGPGPSADGGHTITAVAESPLKAGVLYVGTDDGRLHVTRSGGKDWTDLTDTLPALPPERWVTRVECSHFAAGTAYLTIDRHRNDDLRPYVFRTTDYGATWTPLGYGLPQDAPVHVLRESSRNKDLLFAGTECGLFASLDGGRHWHRLANGLPPAVPVHDLVIHPRERELVIGTHGRSVYVLDVAPLEELTPQVLSAGAHLFEVKPVAAGKRRPTDPPAAKSYAAPNPPAGAVIYYHLKAAPAGPVSVVITDASNKVVATLAGATTAGLHRLVWDLKPAAAPGEYAVTVKAGERSLTKKVRVEAAE
jgi:photosystem II stability/assembly factor-like uncharacterized protein